MKYGLSSSDRYPGETKARSPHQVPPAIGVRLLNKSRGKRRIPSLLAKKFTESKSNKTQILDHISIRTGSTAEGYVLADV